jgi:hypothetical protein
MSRRVLVVAMAEIEADEIRRPLHRRYGGADVRFLGRGTALDAIDDALRRDEIEEVVVVTRRSDEESWREAGEVEAARDRLGVPVSHLLVA